MGIWRLFTACLSPWPPQGTEVGPTEAILTLEFPSSFGLLLPLLSHLVVTCFVFSIGHCITEAVSQGGSGQPAGPVA